jgi:hypothetical protein
MVRKPYTKAIQSLNARSDHQRIAYLLSFHIFAWDTERALELALFRTFAVPSISGLLARTGEFVQRPRKRYDDTELILFEILEHGYDSERAHRAFRRMNRMHGHYTLSNEDMLYVLSTFIYEPIRWNARFGWRQLTETERLSGFYFFCEVGKRMGIQDIPTDYAAFEAFNRQYEEAHFRYADTNRQVGMATLDLLMSFYLPRVLWKPGRYVAYALMDQPLLDAMGFSKSPSLVRMIVNGGMKMRAWLFRYLPERKKPKLGTSRRRPTYPEGYKIEELGTFPQGQHDLAGKGSQEGGDGN